MGAGCTAVCERKQARMLLAELELPPTNSRCGGTFVSWCKQQARPKARARIGWSAGLRMQSSQIDRSLA